MVENEILSLETAVIYYCYNLPKTKKRNRFEITYFKAVTRLPFYFLFSWRGEKMQEIKKKSENIFIITI